MEGIVQFSAVEEKIITVRNQKVILDRDVAELYGVETRRVNEAVKNNSDKFPNEYVFEITSDELKELVENFDRFLTLKHLAQEPKVFTEKGLYMIATILKGKKALQTTFAIIETFAKIRELSRTVNALSESSDRNRQKSLMQKSGHIIADLIGNDMETTDTETELELNFAVLKIKHTVKRTNK